jgi:hypothetical protein
MSKQDPKTPASHHAKAPAKAPERITLHEAANERIEFRTKASNASNKPVRENAEVVDTVKPPKSNE